MTLSSDDPWRTHLPLLHRILARGEPPSVYPPVPHGDAILVTCAYWEQLYYLLNTILGCRDLGRGLAWWYTNGRPGEDPRLGLMQTIWDSDGQLAYFAVNLWRECTKCWTSFWQPFPMGVQDRDWYREEQGRKRETLDEARPHGALPPLPSLVRSTWNVVVGYLHPKEGDVSADGRKVRQRISAAWLCFRIFYLILFVSLTASSVYHYVFWDPESYMARDLFGLVFLIPSLICLWLVYRPYEWVLTPEARHETVNIQQKRAIAKAGVESLWSAIGTFAGILGALLVFLAVYAAAIVYSGWVVGIALGWIPAILASLAAGILCRYLWWLFAIGIVGLIGYFA
jgi:hypothetical protein